MVGVNSTNCSWRSICRYIQGVTSAVLIDFINLWYFDVPCFDHVFVPLGMYLSEYGSFGLSKYSSVKVFSASGLVGVSITIETQFH